MQDDKGGSRTTDLYDVVAVNIKTGARRPLATDKTERNAEAIINMAVMRRGVEDEFYMAIPVTRAGGVVSDQSKATETRCEIADLYFWLGEEAERVGFTPWQTAWLAPLVQPIITRFLDGTLRPAECADAK